MVHSVYSSVYTFISISSAVQSDFLYLFHVWIRIRKQTWRNDIFTRIERRFKKTCISALSVLPMGISRVPIHVYVTCMAKQTESLLQANPHLILFNHSLPSTEHSQHFAPQLCIVTEKVMILCWGMATLGLLLCLKWNCNGYNTVLVIMLITS